jgi:hypothetical protein
LRGHGQIEAGEKFGDFVEMMELAPATLDKLIAPVEANEKKKRRLTEGYVIEK